MVGWVKLLYSKYSNPACFVGGWVVMKQKTHNIKHIDKARSTQKWTLFHKDTTTCTAAYVGHWDSAAVRQ